MFPVQVLTDLRAEQKRLGRSALSGCMRFLARRACSLTVSVDCSLGVSEIAFFVFVCVAKPLSVVDRAHARLLQIVVRPSQMHEACWELAKQSAITSPSKEMRGPPN